MPVLQKSSDFKSNAYLFIFLKGTKNPAEIEREEVKHMEIINIKRASQSVMTAVNNDSDDDHTVMTAISSGGD